MGKQNRSDLGYLGIEFQYKLIKTFMDEPRFFKDIYNAIDQNVFTDIHLKTWVGVMKEYYEEHDLLPTYGLMDIILKEKSFDTKDVDTYLALANKLQNITCEGVSVIKDMSTKFFKQQAWLKVANQIIKTVGDGQIDNYDGCAELVENLINVGKSDDDFGFSPIDNIERTLSDEYRTPIPTGVGLVDDILEGGIGKGELGVLIGPTSFGKTSLTTAMASHAGTYKCEANNYEGFKALQIVFEDRVEQIQRKHIGRLTNIESKDLSKPQYIDSVMQTITSHPDRDLIKKNVRIKKFISGETTVSDIKRFIKALINTGFKPDLIIIDYFECIEHEREKGGAKVEEWSKEGKTMRKIEAMAEEFNVGIWVPTQGTKDSINSEIVTMDKSGGSIKKIQIGHIIVSIARTNEDIEGNKAAIAVLKNRAGKAGKIIKGVEFNNGTCIISTDNIVEFDDAMAYREEERRTNNELTQRLGKELFQQTKNNNV